MECNRFHVLHVVVAVHEQPLGCGKHSALLSAWRKFAMIPKRAVVLIMYGILSYTNIYIDK